MGIGVVLGILFLQPPDYTDLNLLTAKQGVTNFSRTKILFDYPGNPATIWDEQKKLDRIHGSLPVRIDVIKNTRIVTFKAAAILKSSVDSIDIDKDSASYGGYMGITTNNRKFLVNSQEKVYQVGPGHPEPEV